MPESISSFERKPDQVPESPLLFMNKQGVELPLSGFSDAEITGMIFQMETSFDYNQKVNRDRPDIQKRDQERFDALKAEGAKRGEVKK